VVIDDVALGPGLDATDGEDRRFVRRDLTGDDRPQPHDDHGGQQDLVDRGPPRTVTDLFGRLDTATALPDHSWRALARRSAAPSRQVTWTSWPQACMTGTTLPSLSVAVLGLA
jgi:hypothetical protein